MPALYNCQHQLALQSLLLGTHRRPLPEELEAVASQLGIDPELPIPERLLEVNSLLDRLRRTELQSLPAGTPRPAPPPTESQKPLGPKASRALELALGDTYQSALRELLQLVHQQDALVPPRLIVNLLDTANTLRRAGQSQLAEQFLALTGQRGQWLAAQHPEWSELLPPPDFATNYQRVVTPADKTLLLRQWRKTDPTAARLALAAEWPELTPKQQESRLPALRVGLSEADFPF